MLTPVLATFTSGQMAAGDTRPRPAAPAAADSRPVAIWVWNAATITDPVEQARLFAVCGVKRIRTVFQDVGDCFLPPGKGDDKHPVTSAALARFVREAHRRGIRVLALDGHPRWALASEQPVPIGRIERALAFNQQVTGESRIDGFQMDIEPHLIEGFGTEQREAILREYLDLVARLVGVIRQKQPDFEFGVALPFWLDGQSPSSPVKWRGTAKALTWHAMDQLSGLSRSHVAVMAYRDFTDGPDGSIRHAADEVAYEGGKAGRVRVFVGQETAKLEGEPEKTTHFEEGLGSLERCIRELNARFGGTPQYAGAAIHHWDSYKNWVPAGGTAAVKWIQWAGPLDAGSAVRHAPP